MSSETVPVVDVFPTATVTDSLPLFQDKGQPLKVTMAWSKHHSGAFNLSLKHARALRNALDQKLDEIDRAALERINTHLDYLEKNR